MCVGREELDCEGEESKSLYLCTFNRKKHGCLGATNPKDSSDVRQTVKRSKQSIWKSDSECSHLVLRVNVPEGDGGSIGYDCDWIPTGKDILEGTLTRLS